tara:strand:+ start:51 stop:677 length:627 start_codon:yes stop_codon:yes gene_type:complete
MSWHIPEWDNHFKDVLINGEYQKKQRDLALSYVKNYNLAIDIGANIGFWSRDLCDKFKKVWAFEPSIKNCEYFRKNMIKNNYQLEQIGLSDKQAENKELYITSDNCGDMRLEKSDNAILDSYVDLKKLDDYVNEFEEVDFIKIDTQEHELQIINGGKKFLDKFNPVLCIEMPRRTMQEQMTFLNIENTLNKLNYNRVNDLKKESIFVK